MPLFNDTITLGVRADLTQFEKDVIGATTRAQSKLKPLQLRLDNGMSQPLGKITGDISQFNKSLDAASARVLAFSASVGIINGVVKGFRDLVNQTIAVEKALTDINVVLNTSQKGLDEFSNSLFDIARNTSSSFKDVSAAALEFSRQGLSVAETLKRTNDALVLSRISGLDAAESVKTLTSAINGFNKEALDTASIVNKLAAVDSNFAVSTKDLSDALTRVGSTASEAGVQFNELISIVTAVQQTTSRGGAVIGNALKTIFTRISREGTIQQLKELGVAIDESQSGIDKLRAISEAVERVDKTTANTIKELAGGVFQINTVTAALGDLSKEYSVYDNALKIANSSTDEAIRRNQALNQTLAALTQQAGTNIDELFSKIGKISLGGNLKTLFSSFNSITKSISDSLDGEGIGAKIGQGLLQGLGNFLTGPAAIVAIGAFSKLVLQIGGDALKSFRSVAGITTEADKQALIQKTIFDRLAANSNQYEQQLLTNQGILAIQQDILSQLAREAELRAAISKISPNIAANISSSFDVKKGTLIPRAAYGFVPAMAQEQRDIYRGVGGASASARPVYIPDFNFGNKTGPIVANTNEKIIENFLGGKGSAVLNPDMIAALGGEEALAKYGKVKNVSEGYAPNFASYDLAGGKVNLRKKGGDLVLDEILSGFDDAGNRKSGTGIVRQAFDLAIEEGKKLGADNLIVDVINSKVAQSMNANSRFSAFGPFGIGKFKLPLAALAEGFVPSLASPLKDSVKREVQALVRHGFSPNSAQSSIRIGTSSILKGHTNPLGLGVFNTLQGQNSLSKALSDHNGQNLKTVGKAGGFIPNLAPFSGFALGELKNSQNQNAGKQVVDEINLLLESIEKSLSPQANGANLQKINASISKLNDDSANLVANQLDKALDYSAKSILSSVSGKGLRSSSGRQLGKDKLDEINSLLQRAATTKSPTEFADIQKEFTKFDKDINKATADRLAKHFQSVSKFSANERENTRSSAEDIFESARGAVSRRGLFSFNSVDSILKGQQGFGELPQQEQERIRGALTQQASANRRQSFERAGLGLAFAGSLATPFLDQGVESLRKSGNSKGATALGTASGALTGASFGAIIGPEGAAIGALIGGIVSLGKAMDGSASKAEDLTKKLDDLQSKTTENLNGFSSYIQTQQKLGSIIEEGGKASDIALVREELSRVFASISDPTIRKNIIATGGSIKELSEAFAKAQSGAFADKSRQAALTFAAQEKSNNTNFLGVRTQSVFGGTAINDISRALISSAPEKKLKDFSDSIKDLDGNLSEGQFTDSLSKIGLSIEDAKSLFNDLEQPLNRLLLLRGLKENIDISKQLGEAVDASIRYKKSLTDLSKTIGTLTALGVSNTRTDLGFQKNAFSVQQNGAQQAAGLRFFNAGQFAQAQLSSAFQANQVRFSSNQERTSERLDLVEKIGSALEQNRDKLNSDPKLVAKLDSFVTSGGQGDIAQLAQEFIRKGVGSGEDLKAFFSSVGITLNDSNNKLASIDDNERAQISILRQNLDALKERIQIENKANLLGGPEGQLNFSRSGLERLGNRDANTALQRLGGNLGSFGRNENSQGILEFQKQFGGIDGLDVRKFIPNAQDAVAKSIKDSLVEGFGRLNLPISTETLNQFDSVSKISAAKQFERKELTAVEIGQAVASSFQYDTLGSTNTKAIRNFLVSRFGLEKQRVDLNQQAQKVQSDIQNKSQKIDNINAQVEKLKVDGATNLRAPSGSLNLFNNAALRAADAADKSPFVEDLGPKDITTLSLIAAQQVKNLIPSNGNVSDFKQNINDAVNGKGGDFLKTALLQQFGSDFKVNGRGKREIDDEAFGKIISALEKAGGVDLSQEAKVAITDKNGQVKDLQNQLAPLNNEFKDLKTNIDNLNNKIESTSAAGPAIEGQRALGGGAPFFFDKSRLSSLFPTSDFSTGFAQRFASQNQSFVPFKTAADKANFDNAQERRNQLTFGSADTDTALKLSIARNNLKEVGGSNSDIEAQIRSLETTLLRQAQSQQLTLGAADPRNRAVNVGSFLQNSRTISTNTARSSFDDLVKQANEAFINGFVNNSDLTKIGIKISQGLEDHVRAQIKLGVPEEDARKAGEAMREEIQKQLDQLDIKLPKNKLNEFAQGFKAETESLQKSFDDLGQLGASTADSLVNGFGDAFFDIASGAKSAEDAVRGMLSSVAADISKFFAKRAFAAVFSAAAGNSNAGSFGGLFSAQGGLMKLAGGGQTNGVPAMVMGGERVFGPDTVRTFGVDFFKDLNAGKINTPKVADGGVLKGGSGYKDDLFHVFPEGSFVLQKAAVNKYGPDFLNSISSAGAHAQGGTIKKAFFGALLGAIFSKALTGAAVGAVTAKVTGGDWKKGAILGGIAGGIAGGVSGYSAAKSATGSFGSQFGSSFSNGFSYLGFGDKSANGTPGSGTSSGVSSPSAPSSSDVPAYLAKNGTPFSGGPDSLLSNGNANGIGNQSLTKAAVAAKPSVFNTAAKNLGLSLALALASSALAPKQGQSGGSNVVQGNGSITTYNPDGSVHIDANGAQRLIKRTDYSTPQQLETLIAANGGNLPVGGVPKFAGGGQVASGSGSVSYKDRSILEQINKQFVRPASPLISTGSGVTDDVKILAKKGEFIMKDAAVDHYGTGFMDRINSMQLNKQDIEARSRGGILRFEDGGLVESSPSDKGKGLFSIGSAEAPSAPYEGGSRGGGGGGVSIEININVDNSGGAGVSTKTSGGGGKGDDKNSIDSQRFAGRVKSMFLELIDQEKRPGGSLSKENMG